MTYPNKDADLPVAVYDRLASLPFWRDLEPDQRLALTDAVTLLVYEAVNVGVAYPSIPTSELVKYAATNIDRRTRIDKEKR